MGLFDRMFKGAKQAKGSGRIEILAPVDGELVAIESVADPVFAEKTMGDGLAIVPCGSRLAAPMDGVLSALFPTGHAFGLEEDGGQVSVMVHAGIDTVELEGMGFSVKAAQGDAVAAGQTVVEMDPEAIKAAGYDPTVMVILLKGPADKILHKRDLGPVKAGEPILWLS
ncbi:PTS glucose transporter subunit IIA [Atopobiaceae bacterium 24-176]